MRDYGLQDDRRLLTWRGDCACLLLGTSGNALIASEALERVAEHASLSDVIGAGLPTMASCALYSVRYR